MLSKVRQNNLISCLLYLMFIKLFFQTLCKHSEFKSLRLPNGAKVDLTEFADNTVDFSEDQNNADILLRMISVYKNAFDTKIN